MSDGLQAVFAFLAFAVYPAILLAIFRAADRSSDAWSRWEWVQIFLVISQVVEILLGALLFLIGSWELSLGDPGVAIFAFTYFLWIPAPLFAWNLYWAGRRHRLAMLLSTLPMLHFLVMVGVAVAMP